MTDTILDADEPEKEEPYERSDDDILELARKRYKACVEADSENRVNAVNDLLFLQGGDNQWEPAAIQARRADGRPIITVNPLPTYLHQVTNDQRMNTPAIKVHPVDDKADVETAKTRQGLIRHIEYDSNADVAYDTAVNSAAAVGFGYFRLLTDYESPASFNQKIMFQRIRNALSVRIDPLSVEPDGSDMQFGFVELKVAKDIFKRDYPDANASSSTLFQSDSGYSDWLSDTEVLVCDYYCIETESQPVVLLSNGESGFKDELVPPGDVLPEGLTIVKERPGERRKTMLYKITGVDILERTEIKCQWIPLFPVYGDEIDIEGKVIRAGIIRNAKGPCQQYNVFMTSATEDVLSRARAPYIGAEGQFEGYEDDWEQANVRAFPYLEYKPVALDGKLAPPPQRQPTADVPTGFIAMAMHASDNIKKTTGLFDASLGAKGTATSGKQEIAQQREGDVANYHYMDGLLRTIRHCGRCLNDMLPHYYDTERVVQIIGEDESATYAKINEKDPLTGEIKALDMKAGQYDVTVSAGPSYSTARQENAEFFANMMSSAKEPAMVSIAGYLAMRNQDVLGGETAAKMLATTLPPQAKAVLDQENAKGQEDEPIIATPRGPLPASQVPQVLSQLEMQIQQMGEALKEADVAKQKAEALKAEQAMLKQQEVVADQQLEPARIQAETLKAQAALADAEAKRIQAEADLARAQAEASTAPMMAQTAALTAEKDHMAAEVNLLTAHQQSRVAAAEAEAKALDGNATAFEAWKATLESETRIAVAEIAARAAERRAQSKPKEKSDA